MCNEYPTLCKCSQLIVFPYRRRLLFFFQAEDGRRVPLWSRGLGDVYKSLPFTLLGLLMVQGYVAGPGLQSTSVLGLYAPYVFIAYSAVILSFLCGALWAEARVSEPGLLANATVVLSNLLALSAWASLLLNYVAPIMTIFAVTYCLQGF